MSLYGHRCQEYLADLAICSHVSYGLGLLNLLSSVEPTLQKWDTHTHTHTKSCLSIELQFGPPTHILFFLSLSLSLSHLFPQPSFMTWLMFHLILPSKFIPFVRCLFKMFLPSPTVTWILSFYCLLLDEFFSFCSKLKKLSYDLQWMQWLELVS